MNSYHNYDEEEVPEQEPEEETTIVRTPQADINRAAYNPKIDAILTNPNVVEVHVRYRRGGPKRVRQPYVCIIFRDGSTIERPLADIGDNEQPLCTTPVTDIEPIPPTTTSVPQCQPIEHRQGRWNFMRLKNRGRGEDVSDLSTIIAENDNVLIKRTTTIIRKGCGCHNSRSRGRRTRDSYNNEYTVRNYEE
jgi:hypothetical protein